MQIRIESNTMGSEVDLEEEGQPVDEVEEVHDNVVMAGKQRRTTRTIIVVQCFIV